MAKKQIRKGRDYRKNRNTDGLRKSKPKGYYSLDVQWFCLGNEWHT